MVTGGHHHHHHHHPASSYPYMFHHPPPDSLYNHPVSSSPRVPCQPAPAHSVNANTHPAAYPTSTHHASNTSPGAAGTGKYRSLIFLTVFSSRSKSSLYRKLQKSTLVLQTLQSVHRELCYYVSLKLEFINLNNWKHERFCVILLSTKTVIRNWSPPKHKKVVIFMWYFTTSRRSNYEKTFSNYFSNNPTNNHDNDTIDRFQVIKKKKIIK